MKRLRIRSIILAALVAVVFSRPPVAGARGAGNSVKIARIRLYFENGRPKITVKERQPGLFARAEIRFRGSGILAGYWEVDGRIIARFAQHVSSPGNATKIYQRTPRPLPTYAAGSHRVRMVITRPGQAIPFPVAVYFVTAEMYQEPWRER